MRLRSRSAPDEAFDGLTAEEIRRIRGAADACVTPGLETLAHRLTKNAVVRKGADEIAHPVTKNKRGRRA